MTIAITRLELSAADLRDAARRTRDAKAARRMIAIALVLEGWSREAAAEAGAMDRQTLCDWVHRYNELESPAKNLRQVPARHPRADPRLPRMRRQAIGGCRRGRLVDAT